MPHNVRDRLSGSDSQGNPDLRKITRNLSTPIRKFVGDYSVRRAVGSPR